jgi:hypothetical protein
MALSKTFTAKMQNQANATSPTSITQTVTPIVVDGVLKAGYKIDNPGVFTAGTAPEGTSPWTTQQDSNS